MDLKNINVLVGENEISYFEINESENKFHKYSTLSQIYSN
jgi:hypothetical protein